MRQLSARKPHHSHIERPSRWQVRTESITAIAFLVVVIATTLAFGGIEPWSIGLSCVLLIILMALWAVEMIAARKVSISVPWEVLPVVGLIILGLIQSISWTASDDTRASLSWAVDQTRATVVIIVLLLGGMLVAANHWTSRDRLARLAWVLTAFGFLVSVFAFIQQFTWNGSIYWIRPMGGLMSPFGPFAYHSLYAGFMELLVPIPISLVLARAVRGPVRLFCIFATTLMALSIIFSLSRGGMIALAASVLFLGVGAIQIALQGRRTYRDRYDDYEEEGYEEDEEYGDDTLSAGYGHSTNRWSRVLGGRVWLPSLGAVVLIIVLLIGGMFWLGADTVVNRVSQASISGSDLEGQNFYSSRAFLWRDTMKMIKDNPILGVGFGAFPTAFPRYTDSDGTYPVLQAHNDVLQIFADGGLIGGVLGIIFVVLAARSFARGLRAGDPWRRAMALGMGTAMVSLLVHSLFDWNLQVMATALLFLSYGAIIGRIGETVVEHESSTELELVSSRGVVTR